MLVLHASALQMGILRSLDYVPFVVLGLLLGTWVDRAKRRRVLIAADLGRGIVLGVLPLAATLRWLSIALVWFVATLMGLLRALFELAYSAYVSELVPRERLVEANSRLQLSSSTIGIVGPGLAGALIQAVGPAAAIVGDSISYFISGAFVATIGYEEKIRPAVADKKLSTEIFEGLRWIAMNPIVRPLTLMNASFNFFVMFSGAVAILYMVRSLHLSPFEIGLVSALGAPGAVIGSVIVGRIADSIGVGYTILLARILLTAGLGAIPFAAGPLWAVLVILSGGGFAFGLGIQLVNIVQLSLRQAITPTNLQGRALAASRVLGLVMAPVGALAAGVLGDSIGLRWTLWLGAMGSLVPFFFILLSPVAKIQRVTVR